MNNSDIINAALKPGAGCPPLDELESSMHAPQGSAVRREAEQHVARCAHCQTELVLLQEFRSEAIRPEEQAAVDWIAGRLSSPVPEPGGAGRMITEPARKWWTRLWSPPVFAAIAITAAVLIFVNIERPRSADDLTRETDVLRSARMHAVAPTGDLSTVPEEFRWSAVRGADRYLLVVTEVDRTVIYRNTVSQTSIGIPDEVRKILRPGKTLQWIATAQDSSGREIASTGVQEFRTKLLQSK